MQYDCFYLPQMDQISIAMKLHMGVTTNWTEIKLRELTFVQLFTLIFLSTANRP